MAAGGGAGLGAGAATAGGGAGATGRGVAAGTGAPDRGAAGRRRVSRLTIKASPNATILAQNEENSEVQNLLDPQSDSGVPGGPSKPTPNDQPAAGQMQAQPQPAGGGGGETNEIEQEEGK